MKRLVAVLVACMLVVPVMALSAEQNIENTESTKSTENTESVENTDSTESMKSFSEKLGYSMGLDVGGYFKGIGEEIDFTALLKGIEDGFNGNKTQMTADEIAAVQKEFSEKMKARQEESLQKMRDENKAAGSAYLAENKAKKGVMVTASGLQYEVLKKGNGQKPTETDKVKVDYVGTLTDGTEFDNSIKRGEPAIFGVNQVVPGWSEALQLMDVGSKYRLVIPSELAYGENGAPPVIEPNSVLVFEVELHSIEKQD